MRSCRYDLRPRNLNATITRWRRRLTPDEIRERLDVGDYAAARAVPRILATLDADPTAHIKGDETLGPVATAAYPRDGQDGRELAEVECPRYELPVWASQVIRVRGLVKSNLMRLADLGAWDIDAIEIAAGEENRLEIERIKAHG